MKKILIIEDSKKLSTAWAIRLRSAGYEVVVSSDGLQGLGTAATQKPDLILMDIWMPEMNGFAVAKGLDRMNLGNTPFIFTTASRKVGLREKAQEIGAAGFLEKPITSEKLLHTIAQALKQKPAEPPAPVQSNTTRKKILVVEDDKRITDVLTVRLLAAGYEGINKAIAYRPDLLLMDIWMPVGLGFSVAQRLQQLRMGNIPIIFMTASKLRGMRKIAKQLGAGGFVEKPYKPQELLGVIASALRVADACLQRQFGAPSARLLGQSGSGTVTL
jgi:CheY-like chemotaxis protein